MLREKLGEPVKFTDKKLEETVARKPKSRLQSLLQQFYFDLNEMSKGRVKFGTNEEIIDAPSSDYFDKWFENNSLDEYSQLYTLKQFFNTILRKLNLSDVEEYDEAAFQKIFSKIAQKCLDEPEYVEIIAQVINEKYPGLVAPFRSAPTSEEMNLLEEREHAKKMMKIEENIDSNIDQYANEIAKIKDAAKTDFETTAIDLNRLVLFGTSCWEMILYAIMSPYAPKIPINGLFRRSNLHTTLVGDISTAKSQILEIIKLIAPKQIPVDEVTKASLEGIAPAGKGDEIEEGVLDKANDGSITIEELTKKIAEMPLFRRSMDCKPIYIYKKGMRKRIDVNVTIIAACNPKDDFFISETSFRPQVPFKEGIISRFDILIPLTSTPAKNELVIEELDLFGYTQQPVNLEMIKIRLDTLKVGMSQIRQISITPEQQRKIKDAFRLHNNKDKHLHLLKNRPLVLLRDAETLSRFVNVIATTNFSRRSFDEKTGILKANDEDIDKAVQLWENLLDLRLKLYSEEGNRNILTVGDEIIFHVLEESREYPEGWIPIMDLRTEFVDRRRIVSQATFYREIDALKNDRRLIQNKAKTRDAKVKVLIR